jgi:hypothetical protein
MCPDSYRDAYVRMCGCANVRMCGCADVTMCAIAIPIQWEKLPAGRQAIPYQKGICPDLL